MLPLSIKSSVVEFSMDGSRSVLLGAENLFSVLLRLDILFRVAASGFLGVVGRSVGELGVSSPLRGVG